MIELIKQNIFFGLCYVVLSLIIGECHPFSLVSMYDSFPKTAFTFYLSDTKETLLPIERYYNYNTGDLTHNYYAVSESKMIEGNTQKAPTEQNAAIGKMMMQLLKQRCFSIPPADTIQLHRIYYFFNDDSIQSKDILMYETSSE